jgi:hypothetical protein
MESFFVYLLFLVSSFDSDASPKDKPSSADTLVASLPFLFYRAQI